MSGVGRAACETITGTSFDTTRSYKLGTQVTVTVSGSNFNLNAVTITESNPAVTWSKPQLVTGQCNSSTLVCTTTPSGTSACSSSGLTVTVTTGLAGQCVSPTRSYAANAITYTT